MGGLADGVAVSGAGGVMTFDYSRFKVGEQWHSPDGGKTWKRGKAPRVRTKATGVVVNVDHQRGIITVDAIPRPRKARGKGKTSTGRNVGSVRK